MRCPSWPGGNLGQTKFENLATPVQNDGAIYDVIYTLTKGPWIVQPYYQFTDVPTNAKLGIAKGASTYGGAILLSYAFKHGFSLPVRFEYITSSGSAARSGESAVWPRQLRTSFTVTPTYQTGGFFVRGDFSFVHAGDYAKGDVFGPLGTKDNQIRGVIETGFMFGSNIEKK